MIDREKVALMTGEAMEEKRNHRTAFPAAGFYMYDYVSFQVIKGILGISLFYIVVVAAWLVYTMDRWIGSLSMNGMKLILLHYCKLYILVVLISTAILIVVYILRWFRARDVLREQHTNLKLLKQYYDREDRKWGE